MDRITIGIASDHAGYSLKEAIKPYLEGKGYVMEDFGTNSENSVDYPDYAHPLAEAIENGRLKLAIAICGTGNGINMTLNKHQGVRSALCWNAEVAAMVRKHNDANICALPGRHVSVEEGKNIIDAFLSHEFEGGRHLNRINKIPI